jgi:opacity protein-like surface antigen
MKTFARWGAGRAPRWIVVPLALLLLAIHTRPAFALYEHVRDGWVAGIGFGYGKAKITTGSTFNGIETSWEEGTTPRFRLGHMLGRRMSLGYEQFQWLDEQGLGSAAVRVSVQTFGAAFTFYPGNPKTETGGIYLRAGAGLANARIAVTPDAVGGIDSTHTEEHIDEAGTSYMVGAGYEFRVAKPCAFGLDVTANYHTVGKDIFDKAWFIPITLGFNWYF